MCPACLTTAALMAAGATSAGGVIALVVKRIRALKGSPPVANHKRTIDKETK